MVWQDKDGKNVDYSTKAVYNTLSQSGSKVEWHKVVWFSQCNPRMAFILWMAIRGKLQTQDRIMRWNNDPDMKCSLCKKVQDSHNHLFFECDFSKSIWGGLKQKMGKCSMSDTWEDIIEQFAHGKCDNTINSVLSRIVLATTVYYVWEERNNRFFNGEEMEPHILRKVIEEKSSFSYFV